MDEGAGAVELSTKPANTLEPRSNVVLVQLRKAYGTRPPVLHSTPVLDAVISGIVSQSTTHLRAVRASAALHSRYPDWREVREASIDDIADAIRPAGLAQVKATRIRALLRSIHYEHGWSSLEHLREVDPAQARAFLLALPGIGPRSASRVMTFVLGVPDFPLDTHILRVVRRLGWVSETMSTEATYVELVPKLPREHLNELHLLMLAHARTRCRARRPACGECPLQRACPAAEVEEAQNGTDDALDE